MTTDLDDILNESVFALSLRLERLRQAPPALQSVAAYAELVRAALAVIGRHGVETLADVPNARAELHVELAGRRW